jgi:hypothetical protein
MAGGAAGGIVRAMNLNETAAPRRGAGWRRRTGQPTPRYPAPLRGSFDVGRTMPDDSGAAVHESDGVRVSSPYSCIEMACIQLRAAQYQLWSAPQEYAPARVDAIADASYRAMTALTSVIRCLAASDVDATRGAALDHSRAGFEVALVSLRDAVEETPREERHDCK